MLAALGLAALPFLRHARNRLLSGQPVAFPAAIADAGALPALALAAAALLTLAPLLRPGSDPARALGLAGAGLTLAGSALVASRAADQLALAASPAARTSLGSGWWVQASIVLLLASDTARRLRLGVWGGLAAALAVLAPTALLLASGAADQLAVMHEYAVQHAALAAALQRHVLLVVGALLPALLIGIPLGIAAQGRVAVRRAAFPVLNLIQTVPSIALFGLLIGPLSVAGAGPLGRLGISGVGIAPAILALILYSLLPIVRNTVAGLDGVPDEVRAAAAAMGMTRRQAFWRIDAWLAVPVLLSGVRVTAVQAVGLAAVSALIGAGGFGAIIFQGLFANALDLVVLGSLPVILLAIAVDALFRALTTVARLALEGAPA